MNDISLAKPALLISNRQIADGIYAMDLQEPGLAAEARPGQFVMLAVSEGADPFLRRPFSLAGIDGDGGKIRLIYQVSGRGTGLMAAWEAGKQVSLLGPLGNGFALDAQPGPAILVGGGMGLAPLLPLAKELRERDRAVYVFAGARSLGLLFGLSDFRAYGCMVQIATEDGSGGAAGFATLPLGQYMQAGFPGGGRASGTDGMTRGGGSQAPSLYACGPAPFLRAVAGLCRDYGVEAQLSMEERMGCGIGACMGCSVQIRTAEGIVRKRVCYDGPVFRAGEVVLDG
ncbi:MAG: dihydroorotate dehydrogenase electron transfer subunit [Clostridiales bacterium]|nr:dihydroorotate dehydrogenase electron transfer subunit [Clostridiales bacterium]